MADNGLLGPPDVFLGVVRPQLQRLRHGETGRHIAAEHVMRRGLVGNDVEMNVTLVIVREHFGSVSEQGDGLRFPLVLGLIG